MGTVGTVRKRDPVRDLAYLWGHCNRQLERKASAVQGTMATIREYGVFIESKADYVPYSSWPKSVLDFHKSWEKIESEQSRGLIWDKFKCNMSEKKLREKYKTREAPLSRNALYSRIRTVLNEIDRNLCTISTS